MFVIRKDVGSHSEMGFKGCLPGHKGGQQVSGVSLHPLGILPRFGAGPWADTAAKPIYGPAAHPLDAVKTSWCSWFDQSTHPIKRCSVSCLFKRWRRRQHLEIRMQIEHYTSALSCSPPVMASNCSEVISFVISMPAIFCTTSFRINRSKLQKTNQKHYFKKIPEVCDWCWWRLTSSPSLADWSHTEEDRPAQ